MARPTGIRSRTGTRRSAAGRGESAPRLLTRPEFAGPDEAPEAVLPTSSEVRRVADPAAPREAVLDEAKPERSILHLLAKYTERPVRTPTCNGIADPDRSGRVVNSDAERLARERQVRTTVLAARRRDGLAVIKGKPRRLNAVWRHGDLRGKRISRVLLDPFLGTSPFLCTSSGAHQLFFHALHLRNIPGRLRNGGASSRPRDRERRDPSDGSLRTPLHRRRYCTPSPGHIMGRGGPLRPWSLTIVGLIHGTD